MSSLDTSEQPPASENHSNGSRPCKSPRQRRPLTYSIFRNFGADFWIFAEDFSPAAFFFFFDLSVGSSARTHVGHERHICATKKKEQLLSFLSVLASPRPSDLPEREP